MVELTKRPLVPFCVDYKGKQFNCLRYEGELYICTEDLKKELGEDFPSKQFFVLGMEKNIVGFTAKSQLGKKGASGMLYEHLSSITPEEVRAVLYRAFFG